MNLLSRSLAGRVNLGLPGTVALVAAAAIAVSCAARGTSYLVALQCELPIPGPVWATDGTGQIPPRSEEPWGDLEIRELWLERPDEFNRWRSLMKEPLRWAMPVANLKQAAVLLDRCGVSTERRKLLLRADRVERQDGAIILHPDDQTVLELPRQTRAMLYRELARHPLNTAQVSPRLYPTDARETVFARAGLSKNTSRQAADLLYLRGSALCLSDLPTLLRSLPDDAQRRATARASSRHRTVMLSLKIHPDTAIGPLLGYWGRNGLEKDLAPLLESCRQLSGGARLDVVHLLPPFARQRLYTHPYPDDSETGSQRDCHWSSLNFSLRQPDNRFLKLDQVIAELETNYYKIDQPGRLGDVILFCNSAGQAVHSCAYIAAEVVFTKNGHHHLQPWILAKLADVELPYIADFGPIRRQAYRKRY